MTNSNHSRAFTPKIGEVYMMKFNGIGSEQGGVRPGVVFQNNVGNLHSPNIIVLPMTSVVKKLGQPTHVLLRAKDCGLRLDSVVLCENPERMSKDRVFEYITKLPDDAMARIAEASMLASSAIAYLDIEALKRVWSRAMTLNGLKCPA